MSKSKIIHDTDIIEVKSKVREIIKKPMEISKKKSVIEKEILCDQLCWD